MIRSSRQPTVILTLNRQYVPTKKDDGFGFGVVGYSLHVARELTLRRWFGGFILYQRNEEIEKPVLTPSSFPDFPGVELQFNFRMDAGLIRHAFSTAVGCSLYGSSTPSASAPERFTVLYHQSNTLLAFSPVDIPFLITHHGPFASEIVQSFGSDFAAEAFRGGPEKVAHLLAFQNRGLSALRRSPIGIALEMSGVQISVLLRNNIPESRIFRLPAPIEIPSSQEAELAAILVDDRRPRDEELHIFSATSRIDRFKNLERIIFAANQLVAHGVRLRVSLLVGAEDEHAARAGLLAAASKQLQARLTITHRIPHSELIRTLRRQGTKTVFVCSSLYETLCITALEAVLSGVTTLVPDEPTRIGAAEYVPPLCRFPATVEGLVERLSVLSSFDDLSFMGSESRNRALAITGPRHFSDALGRALIHLSGSSGDQIVNELPM